MPIALGKVAGHIRSGIGDAPIGIMAGTIREGENEKPFDRFLLDDPGARAVARVGVLDIGSNSVRMVVFDGAARSPAYFYNEKILCGLGAGMDQTGRLNPRGRHRALSAIKRFRLIADSMGIAPLAAVATAAVREAKDGRAFREEIERETGVRLQVIDGEEEARLSAQGILLGWPGAHGLVCDLGGSSMELAELSDGRIGQRITSPLGPLKLREVKGGAKGVKANVKEIVKELYDRIGGHHDRIYLVGGSWRAIARQDMERRAYPLKVLHEYAITRRDVQRTAKWIAENDLEELRQKSGTSAERMALVPLASLVLQALVNRFAPKQICVSGYGIREGLLYEHMPARLRARDPLIEACRFAEAQSARMPGFGKRLYAFLLPLFKSASDERRRLIKAACLLHDVNWRTHHDYRAEACFDNITRANMGGLDHKGRVFVGLALLHRYTNRREGSRFEVLLTLLNDREIRDAEILGKAMRFGAMFSVQDADMMGKLLWYPQKRLIEMILGSETKDLFGEIAQARFASLARSLDADTRVSFRR